eukprot:2660567-Amphidinium_carterae.1
MFGGWSAATGSAEFAKQTLSAGIALKWQSRIYCVPIPFRTEQMFSNKYKKKLLVDTVLPIFP